MKKSVAEKWVRALRSGKYKQGKNALRPTENTFCCLGVLCDISKKGKWAKDEFNDFTFKGCGTTVPESILNWSGLQTTEGGFFYADSISNSLSRLNDVSRYKFSTIANFIEKNWKIL